MCYRLEGHGVSKGERPWKENVFLRVKVAGSLYGWAKDCLNPIGVQEGLPFYVISNEDKLHRPFGWL